MEAINEMIGKYVIVRGAKSGVFAGTLASHESGLTKLTDVRRLWYWDGAASDFQLAAEGVSMPDNCKFTVTIGSILLTDVIEILPATRRAESCIKKVTEWKA